MTANQTFEPLLAGQAEFFLLRLSADYNRFGACLVAGAAKSWEGQAAGEATRPCHKDAGPRGRLPAARHALRVLFGNNEAERAIRTSKLRIKVSVYALMAVAHELCTIRSCLAARYSISVLDAFTRLPEQG